VRAARPDLVERELALDRNAPGAAYFARKRLIQEQAAAGDVLVDSSVLESHERLCAIAVDAQLAPVSSQIQPEARRICLNAAYLVDDSALDRFRDALNALQQEHATFGLRYELTG